jgi:hypothetical protein
MVPEPQGGRCNFCVMRIVAFYKTLTNSKPRVYRQHR